MADLEALMARMGHVFASRDILVRALTHRSRAYEEASAEGGPPPDNEQLEFLGDAVLGMLVSEELVRRYPGYPEGRLSRIKAYLVSAQHLGEVARRVSLGDELFLGRGEEMSGGRAKRALLANALEALIAALYQDGGIEAARRFVLEHIVADTSPLENGSEPPVADFKSKLQEVAQSHGLPHPRYVIVRERGPEHAKTFTIEVRVGRQFAAQADGISKKEASQRAAQRMLQHLSENPAENCSA